MYVGAHIGESVFWRSRVRPFMCANGRVNMSVCLYARLRGRVRASALTHVPVSVCITAILLSESYLLEIIGSVSGHRCKP